MSVFDQELILPGVITDIISDYSSGYDTSLFGTTDSVTIVGTAFNGPVGTPVSIYSPEHARYVFGEAFDSINRKEATLVAEVQNAWDRGCRTIYAVRVSGKEIYKDFQIASDIDCMLRVSGIFPTNRNKDIYFEYDMVETMVEQANSEEATIKIYKPADRATIEEKMMGKVIKDNSILTNTIKLRNSWNVSPSSRLADFIKMFNEYRYNNVLRLSLVDKEGNDITDSALAQGLSFAELLPGVYFIGRNNNASQLGLATNYNTVLVTDSNKSDYLHYYGNVVKTLNVNTDVTRDLPVYHNNVVEMNKLLANIQDVSMIELFDFLTVPGKVDLVWLKDEIDYEEVGLSDFEMYARLGSGFATTAKVVETSTNSGIYKVTEVTNENDENRVMGITDGIYSMLENLPSDYRVLAGKYADTIIKSMLPKKEAFQYVPGTSNDILFDVIQANSKIEPLDVTTKKAAYEFGLYDLPYSSAMLSSKTILEGIKNNIVYDFAIAVDSSSDIEDLTVINGNVLNGTLIVQTGTDNALSLYKIVDGIAKKVMDSTQDLIALRDKILVAGSKLYKISEDGNTIKLVSLVKTDDEIKDSTYIVANVLGIPVVYLIKEGATLELVPLASIEDILNEQAQLFVINIPKIGVVDSTSNYVINDIQIRATNLEATELSNFIILMNEHPYLSKLFSFEISPSITDANIREEAKEKMVVGGIFIKPLSGPTEGAKITNLVSDSGLNQNADNVPFLDRGDISYNKNLYVPYRTTDNFARQLAQHCVYTGLKTAPTHGIIGCSKLMNSSLKSISDRVDKLAAVDLNLYAKKPNGNDMLDRNNLPYPIGRAISVCFFQNNVETGDNYTYVSTGASAYAGMISTLPIDQSSTSQPINLTEVGFELTNYQLGRLTQAGFVTVKNSYTKGYVITDGVTMAPISSAFRRLSVARIINGTDEAIRTAAESYIGKQNNLANRNSLQTAIKSSLDKMLDSLIERYDFKLINDKSSQQLGIIEIEYTIVPINEIREVRNRLTVKSE